MGNKERHLTEKEHFYDDIANSFDSIMNKYDTLQRVWVVYDVLLKGLDLKGKVVLDAGCGTGWFSMEAARRGAKVVSTDVGINLLKQVEKKCNSKKVAADLLQLPFNDNSFDIVVCSDVIEHTINPKLAIREIARVAKPDAYVSVTVPNRNWKPSLWGANLLGIRPYQGHENWLGPWQFKKYLKEAGLRVKSYRGLHLFPFVISATHKWLKKIDTYGKWIYPFAVNLCALAQKVKQDKK
jgi:ubiquinone/menaquinone biosynthesis C-methylase UbiE